MSKHRGQPRRPYPLLWEYRYIKNRWLWFLKPKIKRELGSLRKQILKLERKRK